MDRCHWVNRLNCLCCLTYSNKPTKGSKPSKKGNGIKVSKVIKVVYPIKNDILACTSMEPLVAICGWCRQQFHPKRNDARYCSAAHRQAAYRARRIVSRNKNMP